MLSPTVFSISSRAGVSRAVFLPIRPPELMAIIIATNPQYENYIVHYIGRCDGSLKAIPLPLGEGGPLFDGAPGCGSKGSRQIHGVRYGDVKIALLNLQAGIVSGLLRNLLPFTFQSEPLSPFTDLFLVDTRPGYGQHRPNVTQMF